MNLFDQINSHKYLYLDKLIEENELELVLWINEARSDDHQKEDLKDILEFSSSREMHPIVTDEICKRYKITFPHYLAFSVRNETFTSWDDEEVFIGDSFRKYSKSRFWDFVKVSTDIECAKFLMNENDYFHFGFVCLNNIIDVVSPKEPIIEEVKS